MVGGGELASHEGTTQGDPLFMVCYALATLPLVQRFKADCRLTPVVEEDCDVCACGGTIYKKMVKQYAYYTNSKKTLLLVKPGMVDEASRISIIAVYE